jgi:hypothetical protein
MYVCYKKIDKKSGILPPKPLKITEVDSGVVDPECLSRIRMFSNPDPHLFHLGSRIPASNKLSILTPKNWFLSSRKYDPGCSSRIRILFVTHPGSRTPDPGVKKAPDPGYGSATLVNRVPGFLSIRPNWVRPPPHPQASVYPPPPFGSG